MRRQAMVPQGAVVLPNANGTAPGLYLSASELDGAKTPHLFLFPGPPRELQPMFIDYALPILENIATDRGDTVCRVYRVVGMGESTVEEILGLALSERGDLEVGYCARPNEVDFRLIGPAALVAEVEPLVLSTLGDHVVAFDNESLEKRIVEELRKSKRTLATAESCTGGLVAHRITNVPGSSEIFLEGYVTYSNEAKSRSVNVSAELIETMGAVSEPVACAMAEGARLTTGADFGIGITGIAGPGGGTETKPVGTVFIALAHEGEKTLCRREYFPSDRETFKQLASQTALDMLRRRLGWLDR
jgi:nicotinamide-nucleotide amidase